MFPHFALSGLNTRRKWRRLSCLHILDSTQIDRIILLLFFSGPLFKVGLFCFRASPIRAWIILKLIFTEMRELWAILSQANTWTWYESSRPQQLMQEILNMFNVLAWVSPMCREWIICRGWMKHLTDLRRRRIGNHHSLLAWGLKSHTTIKNC